MTSNSNSTKAPRSARKRRQLSDGDEPSAQSAEPEADDSASTLKLTMSNFGIHKSTTFEWPDSGFVMLQGPNGTGKSTALEGIHYALFGKMKQNDDIVTAGAACATVTLDYMGMHIQRSSKPERLQLTFMDDKYEDVDAQAQIDVTIGTTKAQFECTSFIRQWQPMSVLSLTPMERTTFFEMLTGVTGSKEITQKARKLGTEADRALLEINTKLKVHKAEHTQQLARLKDVREELDGVDVDKLEAEAARLSTELAKSRQTYTEAKMRAERSRSQAKARVRTAELSAILAQPEKAVEGLSPNGSKVRNADLPDEIKRMEEQHERFVKAFRQKATVQQIIAMRNAEQKKLKDEIVELNEPDLLVHKKRLQIVITENARVRAQAQRMAEEKRSAKQERTALHESLKQQQLSLQRFVGDAPLPECALDGVQHLHGVVQRLLKAIRETIASLQEKHNLAYFNCPSCDQLLSYNEKEVTAVEERSEPSDKVKKRFRQLRSDEAALEGLLLSFGEMHKSATRITGVLSQISPSIDEEAEKQDKAVSTALERLALLKERLAVPLELPSTLRTVDDVDDIDGERLQRLKKRQSNIVAAKLERERMQNEYDRLVSILDDECEHDTVDVEATEVKRLSSALSQLGDVNALKMRRQRLADLAQTEAETKRKIDRLEAKRKLEADRLSGSVDVVSSVQEAKAIALRSTVNIINTSANAYLRRLTDADLTITLKEWTISKKGKATPKMNVEVRHNGVVHKNVRKIGGGLAQRAEIAFMLAVNDYKKCNLIMIDESTSYIDADVNMDTYLALKEVCKGKLVIFVAHETVSGVADHIVRVGGVAKKQSAAK